MFKSMKTRNKIILSFCVVVLLCVAGIGILCLIPGSTPPITGAQGRPLPGSIASLEKINLGGVDQWILIRGEDTTKPVILFLHGGPGAAEIGVKRHYTAALEKHFVVVAWDQRGAGKSYAAISPNSAMTISQFVADARDLTQVLRQRFRQKKIYLVGHSWGSALGVLTVQAYPDLYYAYIGIGQLVNMHENERLSYEWTLAQAEQAGDAEAVRKLQEIGPPPYTGDWMDKLMTQRQLLGKFGGEVYGSSQGAIRLFMGSLIQSTEYTLPDKVNFFRGLLDSMRLLWPEMLTINLLEQAPKLEVPVYLVMGRHDYETPFVLAEQYYETLKAPKKELIWFENSAHMPNVEETDKFNDLLINQVLPATYAP